MFIICCASNQKTNNKSLTAPREKQKDIKK